MNDKIYFLSKVAEASNTQKPIKAKDLIIGATYLDKNNDEYIYVGRFDYYSYGYRWLENGEYKTGKQANVNWRDAESIDYPYGKYHWFAYKYYGCSWEKYNQNEYTWHFKQTKNVAGFKLMACIDEKCTPNYSDIYEEMIRTHNYSPRMLDDIKYIPYSFDEFAKALHLTKLDYKNKEYIYAKVFFSDTGIVYNSNHLKDDLWQVTPSSWWMSDREYEEKTNDYYKRFDFNEIEERNYWGATSVKKEFIPITTEELYKKLKPHYSETYLENGFLHERKCYYGDKE